MPQPIQFTDVPLNKRPTQKVWQVIIEHVSQGQATLLHREDNSYAVQFSDEEEPLPFEYLAYDADLGLYDKRQFPDREERA